MDRNVEGANIDQVYVLTGGSLPVEGRDETQQERALFRELLSSLTDLVEDQDGSLDQASLNAAIVILADREAELIRSEAGKSHNPSEQTELQQAVELLSGQERRGSGRATLSQVSLLRGVNPHAIARLQNKCRFQDLAAGEVLLGMGHSNQNVYFILSGSVRIHLDELDGPPYIVLGVGECVGEISTLGQTQATAHVVGNEQTRLMVIDQTLLWDLIDESPEFARNLLYTLSHRLRRDNHFLRRSMRRQRESERNASLDALTGLANRRGLNERFGECLQSSTDRGEPLSLLMMDVDHFKRFNDTHGHLLGDEVLCAIAGVLAGHEANGITARYGGEEFALVLPGFSLEQARQHAEQLREKVAGVELRSATGQMLPPITVSIGVAQMTGSETPQALIHAADKALYCAKRQGRDRVVLYDPAAVEMEMSPRPPR